MEEFILSAGIDVGTSTTQLIFSRLTIRNVSRFGTVPQIEIVNKQVVYRSEVYFTPLRSPFQIDGEAVKALILDEYAKAGIHPNQVETGAVIITGESSRKQNAKEVVRTLSQLAGDFVVAAAGPSLESVLAGKGAGADILSETTQKRVANLDIGGGTTNICFFENGKVIDTACLDIGGRLVKVAQNTITYVAPKIQKLSKHLNLPIEVGQRAAVEGDDIRKNPLYRLAQAMTSLLEQAVLLSAKGNILEEFKTNKLISLQTPSDIITLSGGVADCVANRNADWFAYGDIGVLLGLAIRESRIFKSHLQEAGETLRATVIGAGSYSMMVSGGTIEYTGCVFPMKNVPVIRFDMREDQIEGLHHTIQSQIRNWKAENETDGVFAIATTGIICPNFNQIESLANEIALAVTPERKPSQPVLVILETDMAKALGQALKRVLPKGTPLLCIDKISLDNGNYIDLGKPLALGAVIPVVVKTLIFGQ